MLSCFFALVFFLTGCADEAARLEKLPHDAQGIPMLKDIYAKDFLIGTAIDFRRPNEFNDKELHIIRSQFNVVTPENSMKPINIHPAEDRWNWAGADALVSFCQENGIQVVGHTLVWHAQTPGWFFRDENGEPVSREQAIARLKEHIQTEVGHFKGKIKGWDVINEVIDDSPNGNSENLRQSAWLRAIGPEYINYAFKFAHEADPNAELYYNDYNIERGAKHKSSLLLLQRLKREGVPVTAVGIQGHWSLTYLPYKDLDKAIRDYKALGLKVNITELDVTIGSQFGGQFGPGFARGFGATAQTQGASTLPAATERSTATNLATSEPGATTEDASTTEPATATGPAATGPATSRPIRYGGGFFGRPPTPPTAQQLQAQAAAYARLFEIFQRHRGTITRVTFWGINDRRSWRAAQSPLLFDRDNNAKPALRAIALAKDQGWFGF